MPRSAKTLASMAATIFTCMMTGTAMPKRSESSKRSRRIRDVAMIVDRTEDNEGFQILRRRNEDAPVEVGTMRPLREGKPVDGEVVSLRQRRDLPFLFDVKTELEVESHRATSDGPAQVATEEYRRGWDAIWGRRALSGAKPN
jgi:hypothetical protein